jgi:uncharacterized membrane protein (UPF0182 family)
VAILITLFFLTTFSAGLWTDLLWFDSVGFRTVITTEWLAKSVLFVLGGAVTGSLVYSSLLIGYRTRPVYAPVTPQQQVLDQYREAIEPVRRLAMVGIPAVLGLLAGSAAAGQWRTFLLWRNVVPFGATDPQFHRDISFFVFTLPWVRFILGFFTLALVMAAIAAAVTHYVYGGLTLPGRGSQTTHAARTHLAILLAALVLVRAVSYWFDRYALSIKDSKLMTGITYTDDHAVLPTKAILAVAALMCAALFIASIWTKSWRLPIVGVALLVVTSIVVGGMYPALIRSLKVRPSEKSLEHPYLERNIAATRTAYGLDGVKVIPYQAETQATQGQLRDDAATIPGIRLVDPIVVSPTFRQLQALKSYYGFPDALDVDRYTLGGKESDAVIAVREMRLAGIPEAQRNWLNDHTVYTHGFGVVAAYGNRRDKDGQPIFMEKDVPSTGVLPEFEPRIYFGEQSPAYSIAGAPSGARAREFDYPDDASPSGQKTTTYTGQGGVAVGSAARRLAYAIKYRELKLLLSDAVNSRSRILDHREPVDRVERVAPWLSTDGNPYPAVVGGRILWIVDGYTTSPNYPNSRLQDIDTATSDSTTESAASVAAISSGGHINYIRNSVKATVDAFDGSVHLYAWDEQDPILKAWSKAFPGTVEPMSKIGGDLMSHLRYPEDLFKVQRMMLTKYHGTDADAFYSGQDYWRVPEDPARSNAGFDQPPYYLTLAMPQQSSPAFSLTSTFVPVGGDREVLSGFLAVDADAGATTGQRRSSYGTLRLLELPRNSNVDGPGQVQNRIESSTANAPGQSLNLSQFIANNRQTGKQLTFGNQLTLPVGGGLLYVQPIYVSSQSTSAYPISAATVAVFGNQLAWGETLNIALDGVFGGNAGADAGDSGSTGGGTTPTTPPPTTGGGTGSNTALQRALADIQDAYADGQAALKKGDFAAYGEAQRRLAAAIQAAIAAAPRGSVTVSPTASPSATSPSGTTSPSSTTSP